MNITIHDLHERGFFEINDGLFKEHTDDKPLVFANYVKGCMLIQNGEGYIPCAYISLVSKVGDGTPYIMITEINVLDELLAIL
ncbi:MAG: hypothetical protein KBT34_08285 [Prevotella sp.]|nr:hypothetical protein [Candidatus Prevotella equi]